MMASSTVRTGVETRTDPAFRPNAWLERRLPAEIAMESLASSVTFPASRARLPLWICAPPSRLIVVDFRKISPGQ